jgi:hypothetical protein
MTISRYIPEIVERVRKIIEKEPKVSFRHIITKKYDQSNI